MQRNLSIVIAIFSLTCLRMFLECIHRRYMAEMLSIWRKTLYNQSIIRMHTFPYFVPYMAGILRIRRKHKTINQSIHNLRARMLVHVYMRMY